MAASRRSTFKGDAPKGPREEIFYFGQGGELSAVRWNDWKVSFAVVNGNIATGVRDVTGWPEIVNLRADPYEKAPRESGMYIRWYADNIWLFVPVQQKLKGVLSTILAWYDLLVAVILPTVFIYCRNGSSWVTQEAP